MIARIDAPEDGALDESAILNLIAEIADENDRLETEVADVRKQYADAFLSGTKTENKEEVEEKEENQNRRFSRSVKEVKNGSKRSFKKCAFSAE